MRQESVAALNSINPFASTRWKTLPLVARQPWSLLVFASITSRSYMQNDALWMKDCFIAGNFVDQVKLRKITLLQYVQTEMYKAHYYAIKLLEKQRYQRKEK